MNKDYIINLKKKIEPVKLVVATKYLNIDQMKELYSYGIKDFGENRVEDFLIKYESLKDLDINWHFIGHLQTNKVKLIINKINCLHSLDSCKLLEKIIKYRKEPLDCFVELKLVKSETKSGIGEEMIDDFLKEIQKYKIIRPLGFMVMSNKDMSEGEIDNLFSHANELKDKYKMKELSMGMSNDLKIAIKNGTTTVRLGRILFNE